jgi:hypothetical protein
MSKTLFVAGIAYAVYSLSILPVGRQGKREQTEFFDKVKRGRILRVVSPVIWLLVLPYRNLIGSFAIAACCITAAVVTY